MKSARLGFAFIAIVFAAACGSSKNGSGFGGTSGNGDGSGGGGNGNGSLGGSGDGGAGSGPCVPDGANFEVPGNGCDDDNDGTVDNVPTCDTGLSVNGAAGDFVKALGICQAADASHWGLVAADYTDGATGTPKSDNQHGILPKFGSGITPREGASIGVLSTGYAREFDNSTDTGPILTGANPEPANGAFKGNEDGSNNGFGGNGTVPAGFPKPGANAAGTACTISTEVHDVIDVKLQLKVPNNAKGIAFDFDFYSSEWPDYVCSEFNDGFIAYLTSSAFNGGKPDNISFDAKNNPVSVNNAFFDRCTDGVLLGCDSCTLEENCASQGTSACTGGDNELQGTGFYGPMGAYSQDCKSGNATQSTAGGATGWLTTQAPVQPGETITIEFYIWNTGDGRLDSSVLLDHLTWVPGAVVAGTTRPR